MRILFAFLILPFLFLSAEVSNIPLYAADNATYVLREPKAWSAIYKYCIACHNAGAIDGADITPKLWQNRVNKCMLYMHSRGYPRPSKADREALYDFLPLVTPVYRKPPVYMVKPKRGSLTFP